MNEKRDFGWLFLQNALEHQKPWNGAPQHILLFLRWKLAPEIETHSRLAFEHVGDFKRIM